MPKANDAFAGVTVIETSAAGPTVTVADALKAPALAVTTELPALVEVANPVLFTSAIAGDEELQVTELNRSATDPSV